MNVLSCGPKASNISVISDAISPRYIGKNPSSMYARVRLGMAQFVLKIEKLSHIIGTAPILEIVRTFGLRPRLWLLIWVSLESFCRALRTVPTFVSVHTFCASRKAGLSATRALGLTLTQSTTLPSTWLKWKQNFPTVTKSSLINLYLNQEHQNSSILLTTNC